MADITELLQYTHIDWDGFCLSANQWNAQKCAYLGLYCANEFFQNDIPVEVLTTLQPTDIHPKILTFAHAQLENSAHIVNENVATLWKTTGWRKKINMLFTRIFPSPEEMSRFCPVAPGSKKIYWYYLHRIGVLCRRYGHVMWQLLMRNHTMTTTVERQDVFMEWLRSWCAPGMIE